MARQLLGPIGFVLVNAFATREPLVSEPGEITSIPNWDIQSSSDVPLDLAQLSKPGADTVSWHHIPTSRCTLMGCLIATGVYSDEDLWFSDNLEEFNWEQFTVPWVYRHEFSLEPEKGHHYLLQTNGITSRADIYLNGELVADKEDQSGAYSGHEYDVSESVGKENGLLIQTYPTNYYTDLALGFIDWNPTPPDNGTGVWRDVLVRQTGPVALGPLSALVDISPGKVTLRTTARNLEDREIKIKAKAVINEPDDGPTTTLNQTITLKPGQSKVIEFETEFDNPKLWWPKQWGLQPLYSARVSVTSNCELSDRVERSFGLRTITSELNEHGHIMFRVNGELFQVLGSGYSADMFLRFDAERFENIAKYMLDMGLNTIRLEGKNEHPELYEITDRLGPMVMAGWECCNKWESWEYNPDLTVAIPDYWDEQDYKDANATIRHETSMMQTHPSMLAFLIGSDYWPDDRATEIYVEGLRGGGWQLPIVASASKRGYPDLLGPSGMKMSGPYDWVPPNYWYDVTLAEDRYGAAFGFGSELGAGVGTPEISSLKKFLSEEDMEDLWKKPDKGLYHMSTNVSQFYDRKIYNDGLYARYGKPTSLEDYILKCQVADYEAIRAEYEAFAARWGADNNPATGMIYWMLVNAWPSLHWNQFDYYLHPAGTYFGTKIGGRIEHAVFDYHSRNVWLINRSLDKKGKRSVVVDVVDLKGKNISSETFDVTTEPNTGAKIDQISGIEDQNDVVFVRLLLRDDDNDGEVLSRNVYWVAPSVDELDWGESTWYHTPVTKYANYQSLFAMDEASLGVSTEQKGGTWSVTLEHTSGGPAFFVRLNLLDEQGEDVNPVLWSDNYVTLWPGESMVLEVEGDGGKRVKVDGGNVRVTELTL
ncbi:exo-beta-D-glucosaminidase [Emericellopsis atlantica]|uniref:Exo-beta-D-glucosaminidase n=1 Tax=Emericellopsis atlantica TaxID=2614577 RepID=A0A9P8CQY5_9HYPO|nr:exo-beta-D-glucosaminidase [Emericellopsis atlantica]KAG9255630.1 exo-beta-D-glucosaminidase [Emericellopsis atlantica]